jgi:hypothetical protein
MARRRKAGFRMAEVTSRPLCRWMLLARMPTLRPTFKEQHGFLETENRLESEKRPTCQPETTERWMERTACLGMQD